MKHLSIGIALLRKNLSNSIGFRTGRRIVMFESDDWGSIRMPSPSSFSRLENLGLDMRSCTYDFYNLNDTLATGSDIASLFEILSRYKDSYGNNPIFTAISVVANPDFDKIKRFGFAEYFYEPFTDTLKRYKGCENSFNLWKEGIEKRLFVPQMHGREHLNVTAWMNSLRNGDKQTRAAFEEKLWGFLPDQKLHRGVDFQAAFLFNKNDELEYHKIVLKEGLELFKKLFGYEAQYFVPPNGPFNNILNNTLYENGIKYRSTSKIQLEPLANGKARRIIHWLGQNDKSGLKYMIRNCFFEPVEPGKDWVDSCLNDINIAFRWRKPAIISSHRVNYIGALNKRNRDNTLFQLDLLIRKILEHFPDVSFMTTPDFGNNFLSGHY